MMAGFLNSALGVQAHFSQPAPLVSWHLKPPRLVSNDALTLPSDTADALFEKLCHLKLCLHDLQRNIVLLPLGEPTEETGAGGWQM